MAEVEGQNLYPTQPCTPGVNVAQQPNPSVYTAAGNCVPYGGSYYLNNCPTPMVSGNVINFQTTQLQAIPAELPTEIPATSIVFSFAGNIAPIAPTIADVDAALLWLETEIVNRLRPDLLAAAAQNTIPFVDTLGELAYALPQDVLEQSVPWTAANQVLLWDGTNIVVQDYTAGTTTFVGLTDTPANYIASTPLQVNAAGTAIEYAVGFTLVPTAPNGANLVLSTDGAGGLQWNTAAAGMLGSSTLLSLNDTPNTYVNNSGKFLAVTADGTGVEFVTLSQSLPSFPNDGNCYILTTCGENVCEGETNTSTWTAGCAMPCPGTGTDGYILQVTDNTTNTVEWVANTAAGTFLALTDTPSTYTAGRALQVNAAGDAIEFADCELIPCPPSTGDYIPRSQEGVVTWVDPGTVLDTLSFFRARAIANQTVTASTDTTVLFAHLDLPIDTNFSDTTGRYTVSSGGRYLVTATVYLQVQIVNNHGGADGRFGITLNINVLNTNGTTENYRVAEQTFVADGGFNVVTLSGTTYLQIDTNSQIYVNINSSPIGTNDAGFAADLASQSFTIDTSGVTQFNLQQIVLI